jgi:hypothetical protein
MALVEKAKAEGEAFKNKMMSEYDRAAREQIGIQLVAELRGQLVEKFEPVENRAADALRAAQTNHGKFPDDPGVAAKLAASQRDVDALRKQRENFIGVGVLKFEAGLRAGRAEFERKVDTAVGKAVSDFKTSIKTDAACSADLEAFIQRNEAKLSLLDTSYDSLNDALSNIESFLDSEAVSSRFQKHFVQGFASGFVDDLKGGLIGGISIDKVFPGKSDVTKDLATAEPTLTKEISDTLATKTKDAAAQPNPPQLNPSTP